MESKKSQASTRIAGVAPPPPTRITNGKITTVHKTVPHDMKFHDECLPMEVNEKPGPDTRHHKGYPNTNNAAPIKGADAARTPANDMVDVEATWVTVDNGAKSSVPRRVGHNNADPVVMVGKTKAAWALVHLFHVAVEPIAVPTPLSNCKTFCVITWICDGNPLSYGSTGPDTYGKIVGTTGMGKTVKTPT